MNLAEKVSANFKDSLGVILTGSVAYSPNLNVAAKSDVDVVVVADRLKDFLPRIVEDSEERGKLVSRFFEGYCTKQIVEGIPLSMHVLSADAFDIISKCFVADIRVYRQTAKEEHYALNGFESNKYEYVIKNIPLGELKGVRTIVPVSFIHKDRYYLGIHRDKLLSHPRILHEQDNYVSVHLDKLWHVVAENLCDESRRLLGRVDLDKMNILNALAKKEKMSPEVQSAIISKTKEYVIRIR